MTEKPRQVLEPEILFDDKEVLSSPQPDPQDALEQLLQRQILNPVRLKTKVQKVTRFKDEGVLSYKREGTIINEYGLTEEIEEENIVFLEDGTSMQGWAKCQTCKTIIKEENLRRCMCGKTCCIIQGCGIYLSCKDEWYCCRWHAFLGWLGINIRWLS